MLIYKTKTKFVKLYNFQLTNESLNIWREFCKQSLQLKYFYTTAGHCYQYKIIKRYSLVYSCLSKYLISYFMLGFCCVGLFLLTDDQSNLHKSFVLLLMHFNQFKFCFLAQHVSFGGLTIFCVRLFFQARKMAIIKVFQLKVLIQVGKAWFLV